MISVFSLVRRRSLVVRSDGVIAHPVRVGAMSGIDAKVRPVILVQSSCRRAKGSGLWSKAVGSTGMRSRRSSRFFPLVELVVAEAGETPPGIDVGALPVALATRKSAPEFFRVFAMSAKLADFAAEEAGVPPGGWL